MSDMELKKLFILSCKVMGMQVHGSRAVISSCRTSLAFQIEENKIRCEETNRFFKWNHKKNNQENFSRFSRFVINQFEHESEEYFTMRMSEERETFHKCFNEDTAAKLGILYRLMYNENIDNKIFARCFKTAFGVDLYVDFKNDLLWREKRIEYLQTKEN